MHGNILDANSTNKLIDQSDEDLSAKIKAEQTRAEGKEKEISDKLANEVTRATGVENDLRTAISAKQDAGNYIPYDSSTNSQYSIGKNLYVTNNNEGVSIQSTNITGGNQDGAFYLNYSQLHFVDFRIYRKGKPFEQHILLME